VEYWSWFSFVVGGLLGMLVTWAFMLGALYLTRDKSKEATEW
jgi:hypothetical protein